MGIFRADPFAKKDWYDIKAPSVFTTRNVGKTLVTRTQGTKVCSFYLFLFFFLFFCKCSPFTVCTVYQNLMELGFTHVLFALLTTLYFSFYRNGDKEVNFFCLIFHFVLLLWNVAFHFSDEPWLCCRLFCWILIVFFVS